MDLLGTPTYGFDHSTLSQNSESIELAIRCALTKKLHGMERFKKNNSLRKIVIGTFVRQLEQATTRPLPYCECGRITPGWLYEIFLAGKQSLIDATSSTRELRNTETIYLRIQFESALQAACQQIAEHMAESERLCAQALMEDCSLYFPEPLAANAKA